jgi:hypothetical protein
MVNIDEGTNCVEGGNGINLFDKAIITKQQSAQEINEPQLKNIRHNHGYDDQNSSD